MFSNIVHTQHQKSQVRVVADIQTVDIGTSTHSLFCGAKRVCLSWSSCAEVRVHLSYQEPELAVGYIRMIVTASEEPIGSWNTLYYVGLRTQRSPLTHTVSLCKLEKEPVYPGRYGSVVGYMEQSMGLVSASLAPLACFLCIQYTCTVRHGDRPCMLVFRIIYSVLEIHVFPPNHFLEHIYF